MRMLKAVPASRSAEHGPTRRIRINEYTGINHCETGKDGVPLFVEDSLSARGSRNRSVPRIL
jgi:hypothetical protein